MRLSGRKYKDDVRRWFFNRLEKGVECCRRQHVHFVDDVDFSRSGRRKVLGVFANFANGIDAVVRSAVDFDHIDAGAGCDLFTARAGAAASKPLVLCSSPGGVFATNGFGENARDRSFSDPARARH